MKYPDISRTIDVYRSGGNVMSHLRSLLGEIENTDSIVEISYDIQAGSYSAYAEKDLASWREYCLQYQDVLLTIARPGDRILDAGTGEMTTLAGVALGEFWRDTHLFGCDISFSRIHTGRRFVDRHLPDARRITSFVGNIFKMPLSDSSIDVVWTVHALEPNGGREREAIAELLRVAARYAVLFEPSYENNSEEGRRRMENLGYVRDLPQNIRAAGGILEKCFAMPRPSNPLNPTWAYVVRKAEPAEARTEELWSCPQTGSPMLRRDGYFFSPSSGRAYPVIDGIPLLRDDNAVLAFALE